MPSPITPIARTDQAGLHLPAAAAAPLSPTDQKTQKAAKQKLAELRSSLLEQINRTLEQILPILGAVSAAHDTVLRNLEAVGRAPASTRHIFNITGETTTGLYLSTYFITAAFAFKKNLYHLKAILKHGTESEIVRALIKTLRGMLTYISTALSMISFVARMVGHYTIFAFPLFVIKGVNAMIDLIFSIRTSLRLRGIYQDIKKIHPQFTEEERLVFTLHEFSEYLNKVDREHRTIRGESPSKDLASFLETRKKERVGDKFGAYASEQLLASMDKKFAATLLLEDIQRLNQAIAIEKDPEKQIQYLRLKADMISHGHIWLKHITEEALSNRYHHILTLVGCVAASAALALSIFCPATIPIAIVVLGIFAKVSHTAADILQVKRSYRVLSNQKEWISHLVIKMIARQSKKIKDNPLLLQEFGKRFGFVSDETNPILYRKALKRHLKEKVNAKEFQDRISSKFLTALQELHKTRRLDDADYIDDKFTRLITSLHEKKSTASLSGSDKKRLKAVLSIKTGYAKAVLVQKRALTALTEGIQRDFHRLHKQFKALHLGESV